MYQFSYEEVLDDMPSKGRGEEFEAFSKCIELLQEAEKQGPNSPKRVEALFVVTRLWSALIEDLAKPENELPPQLRADLISIGIWTLKEVEKIRHSGEGAIQDIIDVSVLIREGLK